METSTVVEKIPGDPFYLNAVMDKKVVLVNGVQEPEIVGSILMIALTLADDKGNRTDDILLRIYSMWTKHEYRREGVCKNLLDDVKTMFNGRVKLITTSYDQSSKAGRAACMVSGFVKVGNSLKWERDDGKLKTSSDTEVQQAGN